MALWFLRPMTLALALGLLVTPLGFAAAQEEEYRDALSAQLNIASGHLDEAGAAIGDCNDSLIDCLRTPSPYTSRIEAAAQGLERVLANLSALTAPARYAASHASLLHGFQQVIDGLRSYNEGLVERDLDKLDAAAVLIREGKEEITQASDVILSQPPEGIDLLLVLVLAIVMAAAALGVVVFVLLRRLKQDQRAQNEDWATCAECGEVLDGWEELRFREIRAWRETHHESHREEARAARRPSKPRS